MLPVLAAGGVWHSRWLPVTITLVIIVAAHLVLRHLLVRVARHAARDPRGRRLNRIEERRREETLIRTFRTIAAVILWTIGLVVLLGELNIRPSTLVTGAGAAAVVIGLVFQSMIRDYLGGLFIVMENQARLGDVVGITTSAGDFFGEVEDMSLRAMKLRDLDGSLHVITNGEAIAISNYTYRYGNVMVDVLVSYDTDLDLVEELIDEVGIDVHEDPVWGRYLAQPITFYRVDSFNEASVTVRAIGRANTEGMQWMVAGEFRKRLSRAFREHGVPLPSQNVLVRQPAAPSHELSGDRRRGHA
jgi:small conductance mechanosensitive channel